jgi:hypothetical protein
MNIAIIGSGNVGGALARRWSRAGHRVTVASRTPASARALASESGIRAAAGPLEATRDAEVIVLAVPWDAVEAIAGELYPVVAGKVVVDVTNPGKPDGSSPLFAGDGSGAERIAAWLPGARVVKAFNTIFGSNLAAGGVRQGVRLDALVAADDAEAKLRVLQLAADLGFDPIDAGRLSNAALLEATAWLNISLNLANGWPWQSGWKLVGAPVSRPEVAAA